MQISTTSSWTGGRPPHTPRAWKGSEIFAILGPHLWLSLLSWVISPKPTLVVCSFSWTLCLFLNSCLMVRNCIHYMLSTLVSTLFLSYHHPALCFLRTPEAKALLQSPYTRQGQKVMPAPLLTSAAPNYMILCRNSKFSYFKLRVIW